MKKILSVGFECPGGEIESLSLASNRSLLDSDIVIFQPGIYYGHGYHEEYGGKTLLNEHSSFEVPEQAKHWRSELKEAYEAGKTVVVFLARPVELFVYTGEKTFSGTGRSRTATKHVTGFSSYDALPIAFSRVTPKGGEVIVPMGNLQYLANYWAEFGSVSPYEVYVEGKLTDSLLSTKTGGKVVGGAVRAKGAIVFLPPPQFAGDLTEVDKDGSDVWTKDAARLGKRFAAAIVEMDKAVRSDREVTPAPEWVSSPEYRIPTEAALESEVREVSAKISALQQRKDALVGSLEEEGALRQLLYEQGHRLEASILDALKLLGFEAEQYEDGESEFDAVFVSPEGRFLGEAEGKDTKAVNIDKLSQLERNLQEDFSRDDVSEFAKGVLFGNAHRLVPLAERGEFFTDKCLSGAKRSGVALVRTPDLFVAARYMKASGDPDYARACREALVQGSGTVVAFPLQPVSAESEVLLAES